MPEFFCPDCRLRLTSPHPPERIHHRCWKSSSNPQSPIPNPSDDLAADIAAYLLNGQATVTAEEIERRLAICRKCDQFLGDNCRRLATCCAHHRDWFWALVGCGKKEKSCPAGKWPQSRESRVESRRSRRRCPALDSRPSTLDV